MPTNRTRRRPGRRSRAEYSDRVIECLLSGHDFAFVDPSLGEDLDDSLLQEVWQELRDDLLRYWIEGAAAVPELANLEFGSDGEPRPGTRPAGWWWFDAPEPRRVVKGVENPKSGYWAHKPGREREYFLGVPNPRCDAAVYESETEYLRRLDLLTPKEETLLRTRHAN